MQSDCQIGEILACDPKEGDKDDGQIGTVSVVRFGNLHAEDFPYLAKEAYSRFPKYGKEETYLPAGDLDTLQNTSFLMTSASNLHHQISSMVSSTKYIPY